MILQQARPRMGGMNRRGRILCGGTKADADSRERMGTAEANQP